LEKKLFAIHGDDSIFAVVRAETKEEAFDIFANNRKDSEWFREYVDNLSFHTSFLEVFYGDEIEHFIDTSGNYRKDLLEMSGKERDAYIKEHFEENVREFWSDAPQFADKYFREFYISRQEGWDETVQFTDEFYVDTFKRLVKNHKWYDKFDIIEIDVTDRDIQIIVES
jgi:hypothetical protein